MGRVDIITGTLGKALGGLLVVIPRRAKRWLSGCASVLVRTCSPTRWHRPLLPRPSKYWRWSKRAANCVTVCGRTRASSVSKCRRRALPAGADHAIIPVMLGDAVVAQKFARELQKRAFTSPVSSIRSFRKVRRVFVPRCLRRIP